MQKGDIIKKLDNQKIDTFSELSGYISTKRPNDKVQVTFLRDGETKSVPVTLVKNDVVALNLKALNWKTLKPLTKRDSELIMVFALRKSITKI